MSWSLVIGENMRFIMGMTTLDQYYIENLTIHLSHSHHFPIPLSHHQAITTHLLYYPAPIQSSFILLLIFLSSIITHLLQFNLTMLPPIQSDYASFMLLPIWNSLTHCSSPYSALSDHSLSLSLKFFLAFVKQHITL